MWIITAVISALILGSRRIYEKTLSNSFGNFTLGFIISGFSLIPMLVLFFFFPLPPDIWHLSWTFWWPLIIIWVFIYPIQTYLLYKSLREGELSRTTPIFALLPVFNIFTSYLLLGELPTTLGTVGIVLTVIGTYLLLKGDTKEKKSGIYWPVIYMILSVVCMAVGSTLDKISLQAATPVFYSFMNGLGGTIVFVILIYVYKEHGQFKEVRKKFWQFTVLGIAQAIAFVTFIIAFSLAPTSYVLAVRSGSYVLASIFAIFFFKEKFTKRKGLALVLFVVGILCLAV